MRETTSSEFVGWQEYFEAEVEIEEKTNKREDYYLAQIAAEIRRTVVKNPKSVKLDQFLLKFQRKKNQEKALTEKEKQQRAEKSKSMWLAFVNASYQNKRRMNVNNNRT